MNLLIVAATEFELKPFLEYNKNTDVLITGIGIPATIYHLTKKIQEKNYNVIIQAGIAGSFHDSVKNGDVVLIKSDTFGDIGIHEKKSFNTLFDYNFIDKNNFPFKNGLLANENDYLKKSHLPSIDAVTINTITDDMESVNNLFKKFSAIAESMEGAAFHYVCLQEKLNFLQIRSISNKVGERDKTKWNVKDAITNLNIELKKIIQHFTDL